MFRDGAPTWFFYKLINTKFSQDTYPDLCSGYLRKERVDTSFTLPCDFYTLAVYLRISLLWFHGKKEVAFLSLDSQSINLHESLLLPWQFFAARLKFTSRLIYIKDAELTSRLECQYGGQPGKYISVIIIFPIKVFFVSYKSSVVPKIKAKFDVPSCSYCILAVKIFLMIYIPTKNDIWRKQQRLVSRYFITFEMIF